MIRALVVVGPLVVIAVAAMGDRAVSLSLGEGVAAPRGRETRPVPNPHSEWIFQVTGTRSCADCHDMMKAGRGRVPVLDNAAVRDLVALGRGAHRGRFADCFRCHPGGKSRGR